MLLTACFREVIMTAANSPASKEAVTAALVVIGGKILSGRTKDQNIGYVAEYLTAVGIDLKEVRVVGDEERAIIDALNALRHRYTYVFTSGGIGPTHGDITADCVAKAFSVPIDADPRALAILHEPRAPRTDSFHPSRARGVELVTAGPR
jgi:molybdopterin-biosynthesis enzyme MoeA-like protein